MQSFIGAIIVACYLFGHVFKIRRVAYAIIVSGYGSEENYEYLEMEEMMGYVKYNWFQRNPWKPVLQGSSVPASITATLCAVGRKAV